MLKNHFITIRIYPYYTKYLLLLAFVDYFKAFVMGLNYFVMVVCPY